MTKQENMLLFIFVRIAESEQVKQETLPYSYTSPHGVCVCVFPSISHLLPKTV